jgi:23S rRNA (guanosine2251-2'-O)-methyltransferase
MRELVEAAWAAAIPIREVSRTELDQLAEDNRGVVGVLTAAAAELGERDLDTIEFGPDAIVVALDGVEDPQNLGSAARAADAAGAQLLISRVKRAAGVTDSAVRASSGALMSLPHARVANIARALDRLKARGFSVVGLDGSAPYSVYDEECPAGRVAVVVGSEGAGMARLTREACDLLVSLPMRGSVESLNVSASLAAALYSFVLPSRSRS